MLCFASGYSGFAGRGLRLDRAAKGHANRYFNSEGYTESNTHARQDPQTLLGAASDAN
jgi:hypothetical protein